MEPEDGDMKGDGKLVIKRVWRATCIILQEEKGREAERRD